MDLFLTRTETFRCSTWRVFNIAIRWNANRSDTILITSTTQPRCLANPSCCWWDGSIESFN